LVVRGGVGDVDGDIGGSAQGVAAASNGGRPVPEFLELRFSLTGYRFLFRAFLALDAIYASSQQLSVDFPLLGKGVHAYYSSQQKPRSRWRGFDVALKP
jgi:hypothetical protein